MLLLKDFKWHAKMNNSTLNLYYLNEKLWHEAFNWSTLMLDRHHARNRLPKETNPCTQ